MGLQMYHSESWHRAFHFQLKSTLQSVSNLFGWQSQTVTVALMNICYGALAERQHRNTGLDHFSSAWISPIIFSFLSHLLFLETLVEQCKEIWTAFGEYWEEWIIVTLPSSVVCGGVETLKEATMILNTLHQRSFDRCSFLSFLLSLSGFVQCKKKMIRQSWLA